ncbi:MAG: hypothetical protein JXA67_00765 [Micromonosporaceae bacterium]|nr:hypothetical protein [Micromonosporaceae bacterium]
MDGSRYEVLLIGGRSGVGKSTVAWEVSARLQARLVAHCLLEGDLLDQAFPAPAGDSNRTGLTCRNLASVWGNYADLGYRRLIYTNTVSVLESDMITGAMGGRVTVTGVLLTAADEVANQRLAGREIGGQYEAHVRRGVAAAAHLHRVAEPWVVRVSTDDRSVADIAGEIIALTGWTDRAGGSGQPGWH